MKKVELKAKNKKLQGKLKKVRIEVELTRSDALIDLEKLYSRITLAESQVRSLMRDNRIMREQITMEHNARNKREAESLQELPDNPVLMGTGEDAADDNSHPSAN